MAEPRMPLMGLREPESDSERVAIEAGIGPRTVMVTGQQRAGTRLMCEILKPSGWTPWHDSRHGLVPRPAPRVVVMVRDRQASLASIERSFEPEDRIDPMISLGRCAMFYPTAPWVDYAALCLNPEEVIKGLAKYLGVQPWPVPVKIVPSETVGWPG